MERQNIVIGASCGFGEVTTQQVNAQWKILNRRVKIINWTAISFKFYEIDKSVMTITQYFLIRYIEL